MSLGSATWGAMDLLKDTQGNTHEWAWTPRFIHDPWRYWKALKGKRRDWHWFVPLNTRHCHLPDVFLWKIARGRGSSYKWKSKGSGVCRNLAKVMHRQKENQDWSPDLSISPETCPDSSSPHISLAWRPRWVIEHKKLCVHLVSY